MGERSKFYQDAELVVKTCMSVESGDVVTIICDDEHVKEADALAQVAAECGASPVVMNNEAQVARAKQDTSFPMAPPRNIHNAMLNSDVIIVVANLEWANRFAHVSAVKESCANNAKIASVEEGMGSWDLTEEDIRVATDRARKAIDLLKDVDKLRLTTDLGTDVVVSIEGRPALEVTPIKKKGQMMGPVPLWAEVAFAAVEDQTEGRAVIDGIMLGIGLEGAVKNPITWDIKGGKVVSITGGEEAERLRKVIDGVPGSDVIGEFAFGTSTKSPYGSPSEKGVLGTAHFAIGDNHNAYPGGQNVSELHLDGVMYKMTMQVVATGQYILKDGEWVL